MHGESLRGKPGVVDTLKGCLHAEGIDKITENIFPAKKQHTITRFCCEELGVTAIQLEINHRYRAPNRNGVDYSRLFRALASAITRFTCKSSNP